MATCPECKKYYPDKCPACKQARQPSPEPAFVPPPRRRPAAEANSQPEPEQYPKPGTAKKKPPRDVLSMGGWAGLFTFFGVLVVIIAILCFAFKPSYSIACLIGSMSLFCSGKLFKCITRILKNQDEILTALDRLSEDK